MICNNLGPGISLRSFKVSTKLAILCPSIGPKYLSCKASKILLLLETTPFTLASILEAISRVKFLPIGNLPIRFQISSRTLL